MNLFQSNNADIIITKKNNKQVSNPLFAGSFSHIGKRNQQQDAYFLSDEIDKESIKDRGYLAVVCDGMGGMDMGEEASRLCVQTLSDHFYTGEPENNIPEFLTGQIKVLDQMVAEICTADGKKTNAGTTLAAAVIKDGTVCIAAVGDSRIYIIRNNTIIYKSYDHNYMAELLKRVKSGEITSDQADANPDKNALTSFIGVGDIQLYTVSDPPLHLEHNDIILICSDGLYQGVSEDEIIGVLTEYGDDIKRAANELGLLVLNQRKANQDNLTAIVIKYSG